MTRVTRSVTLVAAILVLPALSLAAQCTGNPPTYNGLPCASTTRYWDGQMGACGCGYGNESPFSWQWNKYTTAASQLLYDEGGSSWCGSGCGQCYELTPTGDCTTNGGCVSDLSPITVMITNLCPYIGNEVWCPNPGNVNQYGYKQHFDIMDYNMNGIANALGWNNPVVTYRRVPCGGNDKTAGCQEANQCQCVGSSTSNCAYPEYTAPSGGSSSWTPPPSNNNPPAASAPNPSDNPPAASTPNPSDSSSAPSDPAPSSPPSDPTPSSPPSSDGSCTAGISFMLTNSWNGGGLISITVSNTGSSPINSLSLYAPGPFQSWNMDQAGSDTYTLPAWLFPLAPGASFTGAGYTFSNEQPPAGSINSVSC